MSGLASMNEWVSQRHRIVIGMVHLRPLPGTPFFGEGDLPRIVDTAIASARALRDGGADACLIQTVDRVYGCQGDADPARIAAMTLVVREVVRSVGGDLPVGVQIMRNAITASFAVAKIAGGRFIRASAVVGQTITPSGTIIADPFYVAAYRKQIDAGNVALIADIHSMHYRWFGSEKPLQEIASAAVQAGTDVLCLGDADPGTTLRLIELARAGAAGTPVFLAGYTNHGNLEHMLAPADGAFVGSCLESGGWGGAISEERVREYVKLARNLPPRRTAR